MGKCRNGVKMPEWNYDFFKFTEKTLLLQIPGMSINYHYLMQ